jgi:hypothetical protein
MSKLGDIRTSILGRLAVPNGSSPYTYDLSVAGRVLWGAGVPIDTPDVVVVVAPEAPLRVTRDETLGDWAYRSSYTLIGVVPSGADNPTDRYTAAAALMEDLTRALLARPTFPLAGMDLVWDVESLDLEAVDEHELDVSGAAVVVGRLALKWGGDPL